MKVFSSLVSVITVVYNGEKSLEKTILSIINQTYAKIEYIVIDGGSNDGTIDIIKKYSDYIKLWISEPDEGIYEAMNKAILLAKGDWIIFMNSGDEFYSEVTLQDTFNQPIAQNKIVIYGDVNIIIDGYNFDIKASNIETLVTGLPFCHQSSLTKTSYLQKNLFDIQYRISADFNLFYTIHKQQKDAFLYVPIIISKYNSSEGYSLNNALACYKEYLSIVDKLHYPTISKRLLIQFSIYLKSKLPSSILNYVKIIKLRMKYKYYKNKR